MDESQSRRMQASIDYLITQVALLGRDSYAMSEQLDNLTAKVEKCNTVMDSAATLLGTLSSEIRSLKDDPAALEALANRLDVETEDLAAAILANTPAEETEAP
jgi:peptidoglycan hydrolase CwlO-like protein